MSEIPLAEQLTLAVKTFERPKSLQRLLKSIRHFYPNLPVVVADDSRRARPIEGVNYLRLPHDVGLSAGRNALVESTETPYFLLLEDDFEFTEETKLEMLLSGAEEHGFDITAGDCVSHRRRGLRLHKWNEQICAKMHFQGDHLRLERSHHRKVGDFYLCDMVTNFFVAKTDTVRRVGGWDPILKIQEHEEFFVRLKKNQVSIAYCPQVLINHWHDRNWNYRRFRRRSLMHLGMHKHGFRWFTDLGGTTRDFRTKEAA